MFIHWHARRTCALINGRLDASALPGGPGPPEGIQGLLLLHLGERAQPESGAFTASAERLALIPVGRGGLAMIYYHKIGARFTLFTISW